MHNLQLIETANRITNLFWSTNEKTSHVYNNYFLYQRNSNGADENTFCTR